MVDENRIGDGPVEPEYVEMMRGMALAIDRTFNGDAAHYDDKKIGFILMVFEFGHGDGRCNYMSNAKRSAVLKMLKAQVAHFEADDVKGHA